MKKLIAISTAAAITATMGFASSDDDLRKELEALKQEVAKLKEQTKGLKAKKLKRQISELKSAALNDNIKWNVDFRSSFDMINYKTVTGERIKKNDLIQNRLWLGMKYAPTSNLSFIGQLAYYKNFGQSQSSAPYTTAGQGFQYFDWFVNENPTDSTLKVREAYFIYFGDKFLGADIPWTASVGRRPSTNGLLVNYRDDDRAKSPIGHIINMEFDGASFKFDISNVTDVSGMYLKFCLGRGFSNSTPHYKFGSLPYVSDPTVNPDTDLAGFIFVPYDDGQYSVHTTFFYAWNLLGLTAQQLQGYGAVTYSGPTQNGQVDYGINPETGQPFASAADQFNYLMYYGQTQMGFKSVGGEYGWAISGIANGIGDGINDFLDDSVAFISYAGTKTDPNDLGMLGTTDSKIGSSVYLGFNGPVEFVDGGRFGLEFNHGSKYWRPFTYGEDTMAGSKLATRGNAYEAWYTQNLIGKTLTMQLRYTYMDYDYTGSDMFFGATGTPVKIDDIKANLNNPQWLQQHMIDPNTVVESAQDFRIYFRYRY